MSIDEEESKPLVGIIYPPPDIRNIVDKTATFVARNGIQFEERIRENEKHNTKFSFLNPNDPYHAYYQYKITETKEGKTPKKPDLKESKVEVKDQAPPPKAPPKEPPPFEFTTDMPAISAQDLDILKLTAQFVARNGRQFMTALSQREQRNYQFDFLRPNHSLFNYFTKLVEQYTKVLIPPKNLNEKLKTNVVNKYQILDRVMQPAYASIDWHDFVIVETVEFTEADETIDLPPPMSIMELENMTLAQKKMASVAMIESQDDKVDEQDASMEEESQEVDQPALITEIKPIETPGPMKIIKDYVPKAYALKNSTTEKPTQICPRCNQAIPVDEMDDHVRIELLDPKWKEQKMAAEAKKKESNLLQEGTDVAKNLKVFSGYRSDIFGTEETEIGRKKEKVVWDGHTASINMATQRAAAGVSIDEQIAAIHRSKGLTRQTPPPGIPIANTTSLQPPPPPPTPISATSSPNVPISPVQQTNKPTRPAEEDVDSTPPPILKRQKIDNGASIAPILVSEEEWLATHQVSINIQVQCPTIPEKPEWNCQGQVIVLEGLQLNTLVSTLKDKIASQLNFPAGKQKLTLGGAVMKNQVSLAYYNLEDNIMIGLAIKDRGKK
nr:15628_t:CDS:10 [Entrophospora candida]